MAKITVDVPDGNYCSDQRHLDCVFSEHSPDGLHWCHLFQVLLGTLEDVYVNGERIRARHKCEACIAAKKQDTGKGWKEN